MRNGNDDDNPLAAFDMRNRGSFTAGLSRQNSSPKAFNPPRRTDSANSVSNSSSNNKGKQGRGKPQRQQQKQMQDDAGSDGDYRDDGRISDVCWPEELDAAAELNRMIRSGSFEGAVDASLSSTAAPAPKQQQQQQPKPTRKPAAKKNRQKKPQLNDDDEEDAAENGVAAAATHTVQKAVEEKTQETAVAGRGGDDSDFVIGDDVDHVDAGGDELQQQQQQPGIELDGATRLMRVSSAVIPRRIGFTRARKPDVAPRPAKMIMLSRNGDGDDDGGEQRGGNNGSDQPFDLGDPLHEQPEVRLSREAMPSHEWTAVRGIGAGLENLGMTCFANAVLQCFAYLPPLSQYLQNSVRAAGSNSNNAQPSQQQQQDSLYIWAEVTRRIFSTPSHAAFRPTLLVKSMAKMNRNLKVGRMHDAHEFATSLVDSSQIAALRRSGSVQLSAVDKADVSMVAQYTTMLMRLLGGWTRSTVTWDKDEELASLKKHKDATVRANGTREIQNSDPKGPQFRSVAFEGFTILTLNLRGNTLQQCLDALIEPDSIEGFTTDRKGSVTVSKRVEVHRLPPCLVMQLSRFAVSPMTGKAVKTHKQIHFPFTLNMRPWCTQECLRDGGAPDGARYALCGIVVHHGQSIRSGHYVAYVKAANDLWFEVDDESSTQVSEATVAKQQAYLLFYNNVPLTGAEARAQMAADEEYNKRAALELKKLEKQQKKTQQQQQEQQQLQQKKKPVPKGKKAGASAAARSSSSSDDDDADERMPLSQLVAQRAKARAGAAAASAGAPSIFSAPAAEDFGTAVNEQQLSELAAKKKLVNKQQQQTSQLQQQQMPSTQPQKPQPKGKCQQQQLPIQLIIQDDAHSAAARQQKAGGAGDAHQKSHWETFDDDDGDDGANRQKQKPAAAAAASKMMMMVVMSRTNSAADLPPLPQRQRSLLQAARDATQPAQQQQPQPQQEQEQMQPMSVRAKRLPSQQPLSQQVRNANNVVVAAGADAARMLRDNSTAEARKPYMGGFFSDTPDKEYEEQFDAPRQRKTARDKVRGRDAGLQETTAGGRNVFQQASNRKEAEKNAGFRRERDD